MRRVEGVPEARGGRQAGEEQACSVPACYPMSPNPLTSSRSASSSSVVTLMRSVGEVVAREPLDHRPSALAVGGHREPELEPLGRPVLALAGDRDREAVPPGGLGAQAHHGVDRRCGRRGGGGRAPGVDDGRTPLLHGGDEVAPQPVAVGDHLGGRPAADTGIGEVGELRRGVVAPDGHVGDVAHRSPRLGGELGLGPVLVEARHGEPAVGRHLGRVGARDEAVRVARVADDEDAHIGGRVLGDGPALRLEDPAVHTQEITALHAGLARDGADEESPRGAVEGRLEVGGGDDVVHQREGAVVDLHDDALEHAHGGLDLEEPQHDRLILAEELAGRDAEEDGVADLAAGAGDGHVDGWFGHGVGGPFRQGCRSDRVAGSTVVCWFC